MEVSEDPSEFRFWNRESALSFLDEVCADVVSRDSKAAAEQESSIKESRINTLVDKLEEKHSSVPAIASELVHGFLLPEVQRQTDRRKNALEESKFSNASRRALASCVDGVEARLAGGGVDIE